jgi:4-amino-4-deoxy-L-arabinose transferase-like glycosyltransferase
LLIALMVVPLAWSALTVVEVDGANLPAAYGVKGVQGGRAPDDAKNAASLPGAEPRFLRENGVLADALLEFLQANTQGMKYLVAVESSQVGARYVIATGRPVLYMGGFSGGDNVVSADDLAQMVADGELRFVLFGAGERNNKQDVMQWLQSSCSVVREFSQQGNAQFQPQGPGQGGQVLYECK